MDEAVLRFRQWRPSAHVILIPTLFNQIRIYTFIMLISLCCLAWCEASIVRCLLGYLRAVNLLTH
jgi:hypothetical protein